MLNKLKSKILDRQAHIGIIGLGYVGLPLAVEFAKIGFRVTGFDTDKDRVNSIKEGVSYILDVPSLDVKELVRDKKLFVTLDKALLKDMDIIIICVPTPLRKTREPDISYILQATEDIAANFREGQLIILESTTYPGTTEEIILPKLGANGLKLGKDFCVAFSPERVDPGNPQYKTKDIPKVVGGVTEICTELTKLLYSQIIKDVIAVSNTRTAEMVKLLENTYRAVNIGLINELALMCNKMNLNIWEVIEAAKTKPFGFMPFYPGPGLGGHCLSEQETIITKSSSCVNVSAIKEVFCILKEMPEIKKIYYKDILFLFPKDLYVLSFDLIKKSICFKKIRCFTERRYDGESLEVKTKDGRRITVTDKHPLLVQNGRMSIKFAKDLKIGEELPLMTCFPAEKNKNHAFGLDIIECLMRINHPVIKKIRVEPNDFKWKDYREIITPAVKDRYRYYSEYYRNNQLPLDVYIALKDRLKNISPEKLYLCTGRGPSQNRLPAYLKINEDFCRLIGYYLSEGCITVDESERIRFSFNRDEKEYIEDVKFILKNIGLRYSEYNSKAWHTTCIKASSEIFCILIRDALGCGVGSDNMKIPSSLLGLSAGYRKNLLAGLLRGDGGVDFTTGKRRYSKNNRQYFHRHNTLSVNYFSSSRILFEQVIFLLHSLGIIPTFKSKRNLLTIFGAENITKLKGLLGGAKDRKITEYFNNKIKTSRSRIFKVYDGFITTPVKEINLKKLDKVYSIEVEDTNTFVSSYGIISHNCLPCDPIYLSWKARTHGFEARLIELAAEINSSMPNYIVEKVTLALNEKKKALKGSKVLVVGVTYKKDINDLRESPALAIINSLITKEAKVYYHDPLVQRFEIDGLKLESVELTKANIVASDCVVIVADHTSLDYKFIADNAALIIDTRNALKEFKGNRKIVTI